MDSIVNPVAATMLYYVRFLFSVAALKRGDLFNGLACLDHFQERHESTFFAQVYKKITGIRFILCHSLETWKFGQKLANGLDGNVVALEK
jgi:hypothetical protein